MEADLPAAFPGLEGDGAACSGAAVAFLTGSSTTNNGLGNIHALLDILAHKTTKKLQN